MTLNSVIATIPMSDTVTVADYLSGDILIDCAAAVKVANNKRYLDELRECEVYRIEVGKAHGDLIISVWLQGQRKQI